MDERVERNKTVIEWSSNLFGIFWGVWWGMYVENIIRSTTSEVDVFIMVNKIVIVIILALGIFIFTHTYVNWMWQIRILTSTTTNETTRKYIKFPIITQIVLSGLLIALGVSFHIDASLLVFGLFLSGLWMSLNWFLVKQS